MRNHNDLQDSKISGGFTDVSGMSITYLENPFRMGMVKRQGLNQNHVLSIVMGDSVVE